MANIWRPVDFDSLDCGGTSGYQGDVSVIEISDEEGNNQNPKDGIQINKMAESSGSEGKYT